MSSLKTLVLGGIRSGKSALSEQFAAESSAPVVYLATATAGDGEMATRIAVHQERRPEAWGLEEEPVRIASVLDEQSRNEPAPSLLVDCMSLWLSNLLFAGDNTFDRERAAFLDALERYPGGVTIVSNEVGLGTIGMDPLTRRFCDELGLLNQELAQRCDRVVMSVAGLSMTLKG